MQKDSSMDSGNDQYDIASLEILNKCHLELFPKKETIYDDNDCKLIEKQLEFTQLAGEYVQFMGKAGKFNEDLLLLTNYRLFLLINNQTSFINFPTMLIESVEMKEIFFIYLYLKNAKTIRLIFSTNEKCLSWYQRLVGIVSKIGKIDELFAFTFYLWHIYEKQDDNHSIKMDFNKFDPKGLVKQEYKRMEFEKNNLKLWRLATDINVGYKLCSTYPEYLIVPNVITNEQLQKVATFRSSRRIPTVVWRSKKNGCILARSSQPNVGLLAWRLNEDELLVKAIANNCYTTNDTPANTLTASVTTNENSDSTPTFNLNNLENIAMNKLSSEEQSTSSSTIPLNNDFVNENGILLIIDARCRSVAFANRVKGGGFEYPEYYTNCEIQFMNLENIHVIRNSFQSLRLLCQTIPENKTFLSQLEHSKWLQHLSSIIKAARTVVYSIDRQCKPVLIHCSDGWDRTPQILALAKLLLDPFYRTIKGFQILIEYDWLMFGHKFGQRNGHAVNHTDINERCPVFLQWLDCVYQIQKQYPHAFEFNETYLFKLCFHSYSCLFGTFLCDSFEERVKENVFDRTFSVWSYLNGQPQNKQFINYLYDETFEQIIYPSFELANLHLWLKLFCDQDIVHLMSTQEEVNEQLTQVKPPINVVTQPLNSSDDQQLQFSLKDEHKNQVATHQFNSLKKSHSFDEFTPSSSLSKSINLIHHTQNTDLKPPNSAEKLSSYCINGSNGDPIQLRACNSESNLLLDALENYNDDFILNSTQTSSSYTKASSTEECSCNCINSGSECCLNCKIKNEKRFNELIKSKKQQQNQDLNCKHQIIANDTPNDATTRKNFQTTTAQSLPITILNNRYKQQLNEETLTEETLNCKASEAAFSLDNEEQDENDEVENEQDGLVVDNNNYRLPKHVSTSTSGLSEFVYSSQARVINDKIKIFEQQTFNKSNKLTNGINVQKAAASTNNNLKLTKANNKSLVLSNKNFNSSFNSSTTTQIDDLGSKKTINECLDIDGLTLHEDRCFKRLIERDEKHEKELTQLKAQLQKCKSFLNSLSSNALCHNNLTNDFQFDSDNKNYEENGHSYSFSNDSTSSSWDEVEEPEYRLTTWVPDHYVTHCQSCSKLFSLAIRKHHCRNCGQVFCYKCSNQFFPLPNQNLITPVRVCVLCKPSVEFSNKQHNQMSSKILNKFEEANTSSNNSTSSSSSTVSSKSTNNNNNINNSHASSPLKTNNINLNQSLTQQNNRLNYQNNFKLISPSKLNNWCNTSSTNLNTTSNNEQQSTSPANMANRCANVRENQLVNDHQSQKVSV